MELSSIAKQAKKLTQKERNRTILRMHLHSGIKSVFRISWIRIMFLLLGVAFIFLWRARDVLYLPLSNSNITFFSIIYNYTISIALLLIFVLIVIGLLILIGTPCQAKITAAKLRQIGFFDRYGNVPELIHYSQTENPPVRLMTFYSMGIDLERWEREKNKIQDVLNVHFIDSPMYGGKDCSNRNIIVLRVAPGAGNIRRTDVVYDNEL